MLICDVQVNDLPIILHYYRYTCIILSGIVLVEKKFLFHKKTLKTKLYNYAE